MGKGRIPLPAEIKKLKGTNRKHRETPNAMAVSALEDIPMPPADLPEQAQKTWYSICSQLAALKVLSPLDLDALKAYCFQIYIMDQTMAEILDKGYTVIMTNATGGSYPVKSPAIAIYNEALTHANRIGQQFGFSPSSRTKISLGQVKEEKKNPFEGF